MTENKQKGKLIILSAPSGAGKTTIARHLLKEKLNLMFSVSACSRKMRDGERNGIDYYFLSAEEFKSQIEAGSFLEWEEVYPGHFYGTLKREVERILDSGSNVLFDVDVIGGLNIKKHYGEEALSIFIKPTTIGELENRLRSRSTDSPEKIKMRVDKAVQEMGYAQDFDLVIVNDDLVIALEETRKAVADFLRKNQTI